MTETSPAPSPPQASSLLISTEFQSLEFCQTKATKSLRVCCFGSSSSQTPMVYLKPSAEVGYLLAVRGHVCVNGAGSFGCMSALNEGAVVGNGSIVGVIHEMWLTEGEDVKKKNAWGLQRRLRDGGAHAAFADAGPPNQGSTTTDTSHKGPIRELLVAGGKDLQQRKKMLLENADALVVMPGGPGTFDELWEMACARNIGLSSIPIVCVNINGFYDPFRLMLERAWADKLTKLRPEQIMHFSDSSQEAIQWIEAVQGSKAEDQVVPSATKSGLLRLSSVMNTSNVGTESLSARDALNVANLFGLSCIFALGFVAGSVFAKKL